MIVRHGSSSSSVVANAQLSGTGEYKRCPVCRPGQERGIKIYSPRELVQIVESELELDRTFKCIRCGLRILVTLDNQLQKPVWRRRDTSRQGRMSASDEAALVDTVSIQEYEAAQAVADTVRDDPTEDATVVVDVLASQLREDQLARAKLKIAELIQARALLDGRFKLDSLLDQGAHSMVVLASDREAQRTVVAKFTAESMIDGEDGELSRRRIERVYEIQRLLSDSPYVVTPIALLRGETGHVLIEEYVEGVPLSRALKDGNTLHQVIARELIVQIGSVLELAHERGRIVHRDIKPANIMVSFNEQGGVFTHLIDWGIARSNRLERREVSQAFESELSDLDKKKVTDTLTQAGLVIGTPSYMAPEQIEGGRVDQCTDIYSLAATIYATLSGSPPFRAKNLKDLLTLILVKDPRPLRAAARLKKRRVSAAFAHEISKALSKEPAKRHQSAREFVRAIKATETRKWGRDSSLDEPQSLWEKLVSVVSSVLWRERV